jgi:hypothetical protein
MDEEKKEKRLKLLKSDIKIRTFLPFLQKKKLRKYYEQLCVEKLDNLDKMDKSNIKLNKAKSQRIRSK